MCKVHAINLGNHEKGQSLIHDWGYGDALRVCARNLIKGLLCYMGSKDSHSADCGGSEAAAGPPGCMPSFPIHASCHVRLCSSHVLMSFDRTSDGLLIVSSY